MLKFEKEWLINSIEFGDLCEIDWNGTAMQT